MNSFNKCPVGNADPEVTFLAFRGHSNKGERNRNKSRRRSQTKGFNLYNFSSYLEPCIMRLSILNRQEHGKLPYAEYSLCAVAANWQQVSDTRPHPALSRDSGHWICDNSHAVHVVYHWATEDILCSPTHVKHSLKLLWLYLLKRQQVLLNKMDPIQLVPSMWH